MRSSIISLISLTISLLACGSNASKEEISADSGVATDGGSIDGDSNVDAALPGSPANVSVAAGAVAGTAVISFDPPSNLGNGITGYSVSTNPGGITASAQSSPITINGLVPGAAYIYSVVATDGIVKSQPATTGELSFYSIVETFLEPMTQPNNTVFTGTFTFDATNKAVSNLSGLITEAMSSDLPVATVSLEHQLSSEQVTLGEAKGLLVTTFALTTSNTFDPSGFAAGGTKYYGFGAGEKNPRKGGVGNAYATIFVNVDDPTRPLEQSQIDKLAYADCTAGGMMGSTCMTGTTIAGSGRTGTMAGYPISQIITKR